MLEFLKKLNVWAALRDARRATAALQEFVDTARATIVQADKRLAEQRDYIDRLHKALDDIAALETPTSSGTVKKIARIVKEVR